MSDTMQGNTSTQSVPRVAPLPVIRLDRSKQFSEVRGERLQDDPHYRVHFMQGRRVGNKMVLLPFDSQGELVEDDARTAPWQGKTVDDKPVTHYPLWNKDMRELVAAMRARMSGSVKQSEAEAAIENDEGFMAGMNQGPDADDVNFVSWLKGEVRYTPQVLRAAAKARYSKQYADVKELVIDLVMDEKVVPEAEVCADLARFLPK